MDNLDIRKANKVNLKAAVAAALLLLPSEFSEVFMLYFIFQLPIVKF